MAERMRRDVPRTSPVEDLATFNRQKLGHRVGIHKWLQRSANAGTLKLDHAVPLE
jgi:hypothetical protein